MKTLFFIAAVNILTRIAALPLAALFAWKMLVRYARFASGAACGMLLAISTTHLIPEAFEGGDAHEVGLALLLGLLFFILAEKILGSCLGHTHGLPAIRKNAALLGGGARYERLEAAAEGRGLPIFLGSALHNGVDGLVVAAGFMDSVMAGLTVALAIFLHEVPQLTGLFVVLDQTGIRKRAAFTLMALAALAAPAAGVLGYFFFAAASEAVSYALAVAASGFLYIVFTVFVPQIVHAPKKSFLMDAAALLCGILLSVAVLSPLHEEGHSHAHTEGAPQSLNAQNA